MTDKKNKITTTCKKAVIKYPSKYFVIARVWEPRLEKTLVLIEDPSSGNASSSSSSSSGRKTDHHKTKIDSSRHARHSSKFKASMTEFFEAE